MRTSILQDPRYPKFVEAYAFDLDRFSVEVCGITPSDQQKEIFDSVVDPGSRTSVSSGHSTGKSVSIAVIALWHLTCFYSHRERKGSITMLTANDISQVRNIVWKEIEAIASHIDSGPHAWVRPYIKIMERRVYMIGHKATWFIFAKTAPAGKPNGLAGQHGDWLMIIADEAASLPDANFTTMTGALSHKNNRMLLTSQPVRNIGFFYETHHKLSTRSGGVWNAITLNSEESPYASAEFIAEKRVEYGGRESEEYGIRVLGRFPESSSKYLISRSVLDASFARPCVIAPDMHYGWMILVDVAAGEFRDRSVVTIAKVWGNTDFGPDARRMHVVKIPINSASIQPDELAARVFQLSHEYENVTIAVDAMGMGILFAKHLEKMEGLTAPVYRVIWGVPCFLKRHKERFFNRRAQAFVGVRDAARDARLSIEDQTHRQEILNQGSRLPYGYDAKGRYQIAQKGSPDWEGLPSPDLLDSIAFGFMAEVSYIPISNPEVAANDASGDAFDEIERAMGG